MDILRCIQEKLHRVKNETNALHPQIPHFFVGTLNCRAVINLDLITFVTRKRIFRHDDIWDVLFLFWNRKLLPGWRIPDDPVHALLHALGQIFLFQQPVIVADFQQDPIPLLPEKIFQSGKKMCMVRLADLRHQHPDQFALCVFQAPRIRVWTIRQLAHRTFHPVDQLCIGCFSIQNIGNSSNGNTGQLRHFFYGRHKVPSFLALFFSGCSAFKIS